jgi:hypothetical protein
LPAHDTPAPREAGGYIPLPRPLKQKIKDGMMALTMATWCFVRPWSHLLFEGNSYFQKLPVARVELLALAVNILGAALMIWLGIGLWRRSRSRLLYLGLDMAFLFLLLFPADFIRVELFNMTDTRFIGLMRQPGVIAGLFVILAFLIWKHRLAARTLAMIIVITFPVALLIMAKIILLCCNLMHVEACPYSAPPPLLSVPPGQPRVVWMILDETDYRLAFEKRPASVALPEFDRLRREALSADHAYPPGDSTIISMPALISGRRISAADPDGCDLGLILADTGATVEWSALTSVFSRARELGVNTALVGWYHPYARLLGGSLNYCSWYPFPAFEPARSTTFGGAMDQQIASLAGPFHVRQVFIDTCKDSLADAAAAVANANYGLILLHLPPPHGPGVYLPEKNDFTCNGIAQPAGYFNNLVLADHELGALRREMETAGQWDKSWVILSADHSWRQSKFYDGVRDYRVPFLVKSTEADQSMTCSNQFNTVLTHDLTLAILRGEVTNQSTTAAWLDTHGKPELPVLGNFAPSAQ